MRNHIPMDTYTVTSAEEVWWICPRGHEWRETIRARMASPAWKRGDLAACRECVGYRTRITWSCDHATWSAPGTNVQAQRDHLCPHCIDQHGEEGMREGIQERLGAAELYRLLGDDPRATGIELDPRAPDGLVGMWASQARLHLTTAAHSGATERDMAAAIARAVEDVRAGAPCLMPDGDDVAAHAARGEWFTLNVEIAGRPRPGSVAWPHGFLVQMGRAAPQHGGRAVTEHVGALLCEAIRGWACGPAPLTAGGGQSELTEAITRLVAVTLHGLEGDKQVERDVMVPVVPADRREFGRSDVVMVRPGGPDLVVEIDAGKGTPNLAKLDFATAAGAGAVWVRINGEALHAPPGVTVVDARACTRALLRGQTPLPESVHLMGTDATLW